LTTQACGATDTTSTISETVPVPVATPVEVEGDDFVGTDVDAGDQDVLLDWDSDLNYDDYVDGMGDDDGGGGDGGDGGEDPEPGAPPGANGHAPAWYLGQQQYTPPSSQIDPFPETSVWYLGWSRADGEADLDVCDDDNWHMLSVVYPGKVEDSWLKGITDVFGATCDYTNDDESKEYDEDYENGDVVGHLDCGDTWGRATCVKDRSSGLKDCKIIGAPVYTERLLKCTWD
jgi:hypothetical protein